MSSDESGSRSSAPPETKEPAKSGPSTVPHQCMTCHRDLKDESYTLCTKCAGFIRCLPCTAAGCCSSKYCHLPSHPFVVVSPPPPPVLEPSWSIEEELLVLLGIELFGFGNWVEIATVVKSKSALECESHYIQGYIESPTAPRPVLRVADPFPLFLPPTFSTAPTPSWPSDGDVQTLYLVNKKESTTPAEANGWMPKREEFDETYNNDIEHILDDMETDDGEDTEDSFGEKMKIIECFNSQLQERSSRTRLVVEWDLHNASKWQPDDILGGITHLEKELDSKIVSLAPYIGRRDTELLAKNLHDIERKIQGVQSRQRWQQVGVQSVHEGFLLEALEKLIKDDRVPEADVAKWNKQIADHIREHTDRETEDSKLLSERETDLAKAERIPAPMFVALKDLLIREYAARGGLSREEALELAPAKWSRIGPMYDLFVSIGWITD